MAFYLAVGPERDGAEATATRAAPARMARAARRDARRAAEPRAEHRARSDRPADQSQSAVRIFLWRRPRARRRAVLSRAHARAVERARRDGARLGSVDVDDSRRAARRSAARARAAAADVRAARLRAGPRHALPRRHAVRAGLRARGRRRLSRSPPTATFATRATIASSTSRRWPTRCISRARISTREATSACRCIRPK